MAVTLPRITDQQHKSGKYNIVLDGPVNAELELYMSAHSEAHGDAHSTPEVIIPAILRLWLAGDKPFQSWKKDHESSGAPRTRTRTPRSSTSTETPPTSTEGQNNQNG